MTSPAQSDAPACRVCGAPTRDFVSVREAGRPDGPLHTYAGCRDCGALGLVVVPELAPYYGEAYGTTRSSGLKARVRLWTYRRVFAGDAVGRIASVAVPFAHAGVVDSLRRLGPDVDLLDVGSGTGPLLGALRALGHRGRLVDVDPFLDPEARVPGVELWRAQVGDVASSAFDVVSLVHCLEHMEDQRGALAHVARILRPEGRAIVAVPLRGTWAARRYGSDWVQWDPPRHIVLHTVESLRRLAEDAGLRVVDTIWDSTAFQFWGSARVASGRAVFPFGPALAASAWRLPVDALRARALNRRGDGDQATFVLAPIARPSTSATSDGGR